ncbi:MAG: hypothetical protein JO092_06985 [Candidatus Eremiobacteraeota bacterium]|nr:hypothetical protein [Candidatus Eremiobacteraeota bacterium]MBV8375035.1 hypothetical protein [Candidatus Eremiobacteraeota bacterium]
MNGYLIGAGALLTAGPAASIAGATLHAQTDEALAQEVRAAVIDFESSSQSELLRLLVVAAGWSPSQFEANVARPLLERRECSLADVMEQLGRATGAVELHLFARWLPDGELLSTLHGRGFQVIAHPLEAIDQAALVSGQHLRRWRVPFRAA